MEQQTPQTERGTSFEEALAQLRETVQTLEEGNVSLEEATRLLARGAELARTCNDLLAKAELQVSQVRRNFQAQAEPAEEPQLPVAPPQQDFGMFDDPPR
ncbi:MAG: exodeoxyribonuclease VII small subunit [Chloroflexota bacterium]|nr:exodeoxyribonuclease VII small subunit [Chloroflexota bacterium]MDE2886496.1 exodeoxyribonuclease VII small subunit [Chloroflexota bacterium]